MANSELSTGKTIFVLTVVAGCFAVLWPKIFYPMFFGTNSHLSNIEKAHGGCCDVIFEKDIQTLKTITQLCDDHVLSQFNLSRTVPPPPNKAARLQLCYKHIYDTCDIDVSRLFQMNENHKLDSSFKELIGTVRSLNSSLCLKYNFNIRFNLIGTPRVMKSDVMKSTSLINRYQTTNQTKKQLRQERPPHMRPEMIHPALRENGRAIPHEHIVPRVEPDVPRPQLKSGVPKPGMGRPSFGGSGGHQQSKQGSGGIMNLLMPMYTICIVAFFIYTMLRIWAPLCLFVKFVLQFLSNSQSQAQDRLSPSEDYYSQTEFRQTYYHHTEDTFAQKKIADSTAEKPSSKIVVSAISGLLDQVNRDILLDQVNKESTPDLLCDPFQDGSQTDNNNSRKIEQSSESDILKQISSSDDDGLTFVGNGTGLRMDENCEQLDEGGRRTVAFVERPDQEKLIVENLEKIRQELTSQIVNSEDIGEERAEKSNGTTVDENEMANDEKARVQTLGLNENIKSIAKDFIDELCEDIKEIGAGSGADRYLYDKQVTDLDEKVGGEIDESEDSSEKTISGESVVRNERFETSDDFETHNKRGELSSSNDKIYRDEPLQSISKAKHEFVDDDVKNDTKHEIERDETNLPEYRTGLKTNLSERDMTNRAEEDDEIDAGAVQVINMEITESLKNGQKYLTPGLGRSAPISRPVTPQVTMTEPHKIILEGLLPESSQILVSDELTEAEETTDGESESDSVILSSKVTLSLIPGHAATSDEQVRKSLQNQEMK